MFKQEITRLQRPIFFPVEMNEKFQFAFKSFEIDFECVES